MLIVAQPAKTASKWTLALMVAAAWCLATLPGCGVEPEAKARWRIVGEDLPGALFSVAGRSASDVWVVGSDRGEGRGPTVLRFDGKAWSRPDAGLSKGHLLWVHVLADGTAFTSGSGGVILRWQDGKPTVLQTPGKGLVWGVWAADATHGFAVGGDASATASEAFVWRLEGDTFTAVDFAPALAKPAAWFKVFGRSMDDVHFCGIDGALRHFDGSAFADLDAGTTRTLLTIHGRADGSLITAVGGQFSATVVASTAGGAFVDVTPKGDPPLQLMGVHHQGDVGYASGMEATVLRHDGTAWQPELHGLEVYESLHGIWSAESGEVFAVGGQVIAPPFGRGVLMHKGKVALPALVDL